MSEASPNRSQHAELSARRGVAVSASPSNAAAVRPDRVLLEASLLLFLARGSGYGYGLVEQLRDQALDVEMTAAYRVLRALERDRRVTSRWIDSPVGPRRRLYSLTATGRLALDELAVVVAEHRDRYHEVVHAYGRAGHRRRTAQAPCPPAGDAVAPHPERELVTAHLLMLLDADASYGYDLNRRLAHQGVKADTGTVYRLLRRLDADGRLESTVSDSDSGPRRRLYHLTAKGRRSLHEIAALIGRTCDVHDAFLEAYAQLDDDCRGRVIPRAEPRRVSEVQELRARRNGRTAGKLDQPRSAATPGSQEVA
ncbi:MAG: PadR family transcriptional regulator [Thermoleophilia bacterium]